MMIDTGPLADSSGFQRNASLLSKGTRASTIPPAFNGASTPAGARL